MAKFTIISLNKLQNLPWILVITLVITCGYGLLILYSASGNNINPWAYNQAIKITVFFAIMMLLTLINLRIIYQYSYSFFFLTLFLLFAVNFFGHVAMGGQRWISLGFVRLQPAELMKLSLILMLAKYFHQLKLEAVNSFINLLLPIIGIIFPTILVLKQPDLGTGVILIIIAITIFYAIGVYLWKFIASFIIFLISLPLIWYNMYDYQRKRLTVFFNPEHDPLGAGYNIIQSKIAIGSGGLFGQGLGQGSQSHLDFLPEHQTDFIFACLAEDLGLLGALFLLLLYVIIILCSYSIAINCKHNFGKLITVGVTGAFFSHIFINIGMVMGLLPVVGVPLPFISYGGTITATMLIGFGLIMNVKLHRNII